MIPRLYDQGPPGELWLAPCPIRGAVLLAVLLAALVAAPLAIVGCTIRGAKDCESPACAVPPPPPAPDMRRAPRPASRPRPPIAAPGGPL